MEKRFISTSTHILDPANPSTPPIRASPPPQGSHDGTTLQEKVDPLAADSDKRSLYEKLEAQKMKKQEAFEEAYKFSHPPSRFPCPRFPRLGSLVLRWPRPKSVFIHNWFGEFEGVFAGSGADGEVI